MMAWVLSLLAKNLSVIIYTSGSLYQALGVPTGPHGAFRDYQVDAITMEISPKFHSTERVLFLLRVGRSVSVNYTSNFAP